MRIGVLGTGTVGRALGAKLAEIRHDVVIGSRDPAALAGRTEKDQGEPESFVEWRATHADIALATFREAAEHAELVIVATSGAGALEALGSAGAEHLQGKTLLDVTNPLDFSSGAPALFTSSTDSLAEQIQRAHPGAKVVKSLNAVTSRVIIEPGELAGGEHTMFVAGEDDAAKEQVTALLREGFGWRHVLDLGDLTGARSMEMYVLFWLRLSFGDGHPDGECPRRDVTDQTPPTRDEEVAVTNYVLLHLQGGAQISVFETLSVM